MGRGAQPTKPKVKAKPATTRKARKSEGSRVHDLEKRLEEALKREAEAFEHQTATAEILRLISSSPTDLPPVFDSIAELSVRLCDALFSAVFKVEADHLHMVARHNVSPEGLTVLERLYPLPLSSELGPARCVRERTTINIADTENHPRMTPEGLRAARGLGYRSLTMVPMLRGDLAIGLIALAHRDTGAFSGKKIALLQTFADQAVIAIENVRLFTELEERNRELAGTSEVLRVMSRSPTDAQPVFEAIVDSAARLTGAQVAAVLRFDGELVHYLAGFSPVPGAHEQYRQLFPRPLEPGAPATRAIRERCIVRIPDVERDETIPPGARERIRLAGIRSNVQVPMMRNDVAIGLIGVGRTEPTPFTDKQVTLLQTFADQAVIAIENVRLFTELQEKNDALTRAHAQVSESLEQQTATAEILRVISQSQTDVQSVFDTIVRNAVRLCGASNGGVYRFDGELVHSVAHDGYTAEQLEDWRRQWPRPVTAANLACQAIVTRSLVRLADLDTAPNLRELTPEALENLRARGARSFIAVPMARQHEVIGAISLAHRDVDAFSDAHVELLKTFADQAVIAIENASLLTELQARTRELTRSVGELTALGDVGRALSSTLDLETVLQTIVTRANTLAGTAGCAIWEYDDAHEEFRLRASHYAEERDAAILGASDRVTAIRRGQGVTTQVFELRQPVQIPDIATEGAYESLVRRPLIEAGHHALLGVPLLREDEVIGVLTVTRKTPGEFELEVVRLLSTFATQSALAIQNARLFRELEHKGRELAAASKHKSEFLANMSHELRTPLNAIIGYSELLEEEAGDLDGGRLVPDLQKIATAAKHQLSLINDILDLSKIEAGRMELEVGAFDLPTAIENALTLIRERATRRGITLGSTIDSSVTSIRADERKVKQVLLNLLSNALKFTREGGRIDVGATVNEGLVEVSVADTGVGIAPEDQEAIFEEFRQVGTADKKVEGTGLGLALSRKFIELHGGRICVESQVGHGSTFTFTLPVRREE